MPAKSYLITELDKMGGPYRILAHCVAVRHNTAAAAAISHGERCICPRAVALHLLQHPNSYPFIGIPYAISDDCIADTHNTVAAARRADFRCTCEGAAIVFRTWRRDVGSRAYLGANVASRRKPARRAGKISPVASQEVAERMPDLRKGTCRIFTGRLIADGGFAEGVSKAAFVARDWAKAQCHGCPVLEECAGWTKRNEFPAGSWGGVYGGQDPWDRKGAPLNRERMHTDTQEEVLQNV